MLFVHNKKAFKDYDGAKLLHGEQRSLDFYM